MPFFRIGKLFEPGKRGLIEYLYFRIFLVSFVLIIVPLVFHNLLMYQRDYEDRKEDLFLTLHVLAENREHAFQRHFHSHMLALELLSRRVDFSHQKTADELARLNQYLGAVAEKSIANLIFYLQQSSNGELICTASSIPDMIGKSVPLINQAKDVDEFILFSDGELGCKSCLFLCKRIPESATTPLGIMVTGIPGEHFIDQVKKEEYTPYPLTLSILNEDKTVVLSSFHPSIGKKIEFYKEEIHHQKNKPSLALYPETDSENSFRLVAKEKRGFAVVIPFKSTNFFLMVDVLESHLQQLQYREYIVRFISFILFLLFIGGGGAVLFTRKIVKPYNQLYDVMERVSTGEQTARYQYDSWGFEINIIGNIFNRTIESVIEKSQEAERHRLEKLILEQELQIGRKIQMSMLPSRIPEFPGLDIASAYVPAKEVGGDFYDLFLNEHEGKQQLAIVMADTSGKGISACLYSLSIRSLLRSIGSTAKSVSEILSHANNLFYQDVGDTGMFVTTWVGLYDKSNKELRYSSCGHYPALLMRKEGTLEELNTPGIALGVEKMEKTESSSVTLTSGDMLFLYTDGVIEANNRKGEFYGKERMRECILRNTKGKTSQGIIDSLKKDVDDFTEGADPFDDLTVLVVRVL